MEWTDRHQTVPTDGVPTLVNGSATAWCLIDTSAKALRGLAEEVIKHLFANKYGSEVSKEWIDKLGNNPECGSREAAQAWFEGCMVSSGRDKYAFSGPRMLLALARRRRMLLWPAMFVRKGYPWDGAGKAKLSRTMELLTDLEFSFVTKSSVATHLMASCSPVDDWISLSPSAYLKALSISTESEHSKSSTKTELVSLFRKLQAVAPVCKHDARAVVEQAETILRQRRRLEKDTLRFGPNGVRADAQELVSAFLMMSEVDHRKTRKQSDAAYALFLEYLSQRGAIPRLRDITRPIHARGPAGFLACETACKSFQIPGVNSVQ